jgi:hypothetical protein
MKERCASKLSARGSSPTRPLKLSATPFSEQSRAAPRSTPTPIAGSQRLSRHTMLRLHDTRPIWIVVVARGAHKRRAMLQLAPRTQRLRLPAPPAQRQMQQLPREQRLQTRPLLRQGRARDKRVLIPGSLRRPLADQSNRSALVREKRLVQMDEPFSLCASLQRIGLAGDGGSVL